MSHLLIRPFEARDLPDVLTLIGSIQREEFAIDVTVAEQPDLASIDIFYQSGAGQFWVATWDDKVVGSIGLKDIGQRQAALRKMFVAEPYRGQQYGVAAALLNTLRAHATAQAVEDIFLGTTEQFLAAQQFYAKHGFIGIAADALPESFPRMAVDSRFYRLTL